MDLPTPYVAQETVHGYAATVHSAQGMTCDTAHVVATGDVPRDALYVALTRGRASNRLYVGSPPADCDRPAASIDNLAQRLRASTGRDGRPDAASAIGHTR